MLVAPVHNLLTFDLALLFDKPFVWASYHSTPAICQAHFLQRFLAITARKGFGTPSACDRCEIFPSGDLSFEVCQICFLLRSCIRKPVLFGRFGIPSTSEPSISVKDFPCHSPFLVSHLRSANFSTSLKHVRLITILNHSPKSYQAVNLILFKDPGHDNHFNQKQKQPPPSTSSASPNSMAMSAETSRIHSNSKKRNLSLRTQENPDIS